MENERKYYVDSYGRTHSFYEDIVVLSNMRKRNTKDVRPEVIELLQRIYSRNTDLYSFVVAEYISLELNVRLSTVLKVFSELQKENVLTQNTVNAEKSKALKISAWAKNIYKITGMINNY